jgi:hypothetical protein
MNLLLDAWFERSNPMLRVLDQNTGQEVISWDKDTVDNALDTGLICSEDFKQQLSDQEFLELVACLGV